jgi:hypothetical protein
MTRPAHRPSGLPLSLRWLGVGVTALPTGWLVFTALLDAVSLSELLGVVLLGLVLGAWGLGWRLGGLMGSGVLLWIGWDYVSWDSGPLKPLGGLLLLQILPVAALLWQGWRAHQRSRAR